MSSASHRLRRRPRFARQRRNAGLLTVIPHLTRRAPAAAPAPRPPCLTGRCHCRTWGLHTRWTPTGAFAGFDGLRGGAQPGAGPAKAAFGESGSTRIAVVDKDTGQPSGPVAVDMPPISPRSQLATSGSSPMAACSAACNDPGIRVASIPLRTNASEVIVYMTAVVGKVCSGMSSSTKSSTSRTAGGAGSRRRDW